MKLVGAGSIALPEVVRRLTAEPARVFGLPYGGLSPGAPGDVVVLDPEASWEVSADRLLSKGKNTPLDGLSLQGRVMATLLEGRIVFDAREGR
jgi:dihydroorotase